MIGQALGEGKGHNLRNVHFEEKGSKTKKHNHFKLESCSREPGLNFHILCKYQIGFSLAHWETPNEVPFSAKDKNVQHNLSKLYQTFTQAKPNSNQRAGFSGHFSGS